MTKSSTERGSSGEKSSLTRADWEQAALALISEQGISALRVEPLARRLGITKGSFYWHFPGRDELLTCSLARWEQQDRQHLKLSLRAASAPAERLADFVWRTSRQTLTHRVYVALCASPEHPCIRPVLRRVTERRIKYLAAALKELGLTERAACHRANLMYSSYVGYLQLQAQGLVPDKDEPEFDSYVQHVIEALIED